MSKNILITGANGYLGLRVAERILHDNDHTLTLWLHAKDQAELDSKSAKIRASLPGLDNRLNFCGGELAADRPFDTVPWDKVTSVIHSAALTNFNVKEADANAINRDGTVKFLEAAKHSSNLEKFTYISTVYASGLREGAVPEEFVSNEFGFSNHYERSKWECEEIIHTQYNDLPWEISRVATVLADNESGIVTQQNAVHNTLKLMYYGLISLIPGFASTPVYLVTGEETVRSVAQLHLNAPTKEIFNITHDYDSSIKLGAMIDLAYDVFMEEQAFRSRRILKPLFTDEKAFNSLVESVQGFGGQVLAQAVTSIAPFGKQLFIKKLMMNENLKNHDQNFTDFNPEKVIQETCRYLIKTNFKKA